MLANNEVTFKEVEEWGNEYCDTVTSTAFRWTKSKVS